MTYEDYKNGDDKTVKTVKKKREGNGICIRQRRMGAWTSHLLGVIVW